MAEIDMQKKSGGGLGWLWGLLALLAVILLVWWIWPDDDDEVVDTPVAEAPLGTTPEPVAQGPGASIGDILGNPAAHVDQPWQNESVRVVEVPTDRGFWIEDQGQRLFAIVIDQPAEQPVDINPGQELRISEAMLRDRTFLPQIPGDPLDAETENMAEGQPIFLTVDEDNIQVLTQGNPQPGTDPAQTAPGTGG